MVLNEKHVKGLGFGKDLDALHKYSIYTTMFIGIYCAVCLYAEHIYKPFGRDICKHNKLKHQRHIHESSMQNRGWTSSLIHRRKFLVDYWQFSNCRLITIKEHLLIAVFLHRLHVHLVRFSFQKTKIQKQQWRCLVVCYNISPV